MSCTTCGNTCGQNCGCESGLVTPPSCGSQNCPDPNPCSETFDSQCIIYTGAPIKCGNDTVVATNDTVAEALESVVDYFCSTPAPASCICLYEAKVTLNKTDMITPSTVFPGRVAKLIPITVGANEAIEVVSASYSYVASQDPFDFVSGDARLFLQIENLDDPQFTSGNARVLEGTRTGVYLMQNYEYTLAEALPNMAFGDNLYVVVNGVANSTGTPNGTITFTVLYKKTKY